MSTSLRLCLFFFLLLACLWLSACRATGQTPILYGDDVKRRPGASKPYIIANKVYYPLPDADGYVEEGVASWYGPKFHGKRTSNGETYNMHAPTAAHRTLPFNTMLLVRNLENGREVMVRVNDRGPFARNRVLDLTRAMAIKLDMIRKGTAKVRIVAMGETVTRRDAQNQTRRSFVPHPNLYTGEFYVQVGAFIKRDNAERLARSLTKSHSKVVIQRFLTDEKIFHRVQVYAGTKLQTARDVEKRLLGSGFPEAFVVAK